ncbi:MAG: RHS repeat protein, partial [Aridibacter famidurans]|nr:RHS repeat protein [Aridibacter famidurans]
LNNLKTVSQGVQTRTFTYSSLSRLLTAANPESGTISYVYDNNGNLTSKTDARGVTTSYSYDNVNRLINRSYANEPAGQLTTPTTTYIYDDPAIPSSKGKLTKVSSTRGSENISQTRYTEFDLRGRIEESVQVTPIGDEDFLSAPQRTMRYTYNLSGALIEETYPSGRVVRNSIDDIGRLALVESKKDANSVYWNYASQFAFSAAGAVSSMRHGNGTWESNTFNARLQPTQIALGSTPGTDNLLDLTYTYNTKSGGVDNPDNNGNVLSQNIKVEDVGSDPGFDAVQTYSYDPLNRIKTAEEVIDQSPTVSFKQTFLYDRYGNRNFDDEDPSNTTTLTWGCLNGQDPAICPEDRERENPEIEKSTNRIKELQPDGDQQKDYEYDAGGNTILDPDGRQFFYDGENKQIRVEDINDDPIGEYVYDGDGRRVMKKVPLPGGNTETTVFVYDAGDKLVAEYSTTVASQQNAQVSYLTNDHLGSPRITTDKNGKVYSRRDFLPFGEELTATITPERIPGVGYGSDSVRQKFTGYERDDETELDFAEARMFNYRLGRFSSTDLYGPWAMPERKAKRFQSTPQQWNRYTYVTNNPQKLTDPSGYEVYDRNTVSAEEQKRIHDALVRISNNGNSEQRRVAKWILKNDIMIKLAGESSTFDEAVGIRRGSAPVLSERLEKFLSSDEAASYLEMVINEKLVSGTEDADAALEGVLVHGGRHAWVQGRALQSVSSDCGSRCYYSISDFKSEELAFTSEADYLLSRAKAGSEAHERVGLGKGGRYELLAREGNRLEINKERIRNILAGPRYRLTENNRGLTTIERFRRIGIRIPERGN